VVGLAVGIALVLLTHGAFDVDRLRHLSARICDAAAATSVEAPGVDPNLSGLGSWFAQA